MILQEEIKEEISLPKPYVGRFFKLFKIEKIKRAPKAQNLIGQPNFPLTQNSVSEEGPEIPQLAKADLVKLTKESDFENSDFDNDEESKNTPTYSDQEKDDFKRKVKGKILYVRC